MELTAERLRQILSYDPDTGEWRWLISPRYRINSGDRAGYIGLGYWQIQIGGRGYRAHRLAWLYMTGEWPKNEIDHANLDRSDCRWANLREATKRQNQANIGPRRGNQSGFKGVYRTGRGKPWRSQIKAEGRFMSLGSYDTKEEAHNAYLSAAEKYFGEFARGA